MTDSLHDEEKIGSFVGRNTPYYRDKWKPFGDMSGSVLSFNGASLFFGPLWLLYRKIYVPLFWVVLVLAVDVALRLYVEDRFPEPVSIVWSVIVAIVWLGVFGFLANYWYWARYCRIERQAVARHADRKAQLDYLKSRGGTHLVAVSSIGAILLVSSLWGGYWAYQGFRAGVVLDATGPLTYEEIQMNLLQFMEEPLIGPRKDCVFEEIAVRARAVGDPESLDPATVAGLRAERWDRLDAQDKRFELTEALVMQALRACIRTEKRPR